MYMVLSTVTSKKMATMPTTMRSKTNGAELSMTSLSCSSAGAGDYGERGPELQCPVLPSSRSLLPVGRRDLTLVAPGYIYSGFAIGPEVCPLFRDGGMIPQACKRCVAQ